MPPLPAANKVVRFDFHQSLGEDTRVLNHIFVQYAGLNSLVDLEAWIAVITGHWSADWGTHLSSDLSLVGLTGTDLSSATSPVAHQDVAIAGGEANAALPANVASVLKFIVSRRYRGGHPKIYQAGRVDEQQHDEQTWDGANIAQWTADWTTFIGHILGGAPVGLGVVEHVNVSYFSGFHLVTPPSGRTRAVPTVRAVPVVDPVIGYVGNPHIASQRRRTLQSS